MLVLLAALALPASATAAPLEGQWHLDEPDCAGGPCPHSDSSGNGFTATEVGSPTTVAGRFGNAMRFPTDGDYLNAGNHALLQPPQVTVLTWVRAAATPATVKAVVAQGAAGSCAYSSYSLYTGGSKDVSGLRFYIANALGSTFVSPPASNAMWNGAWHVVAGTYDGAFVRLYVDGNQVGSTAGSGNIGYGLDVSNNFIIGNTDNPSCTDPGGNNFSGDIDEVRVYDRALTPNEIACLASPGGSSPPVLVDGESPPACGAATPPEPTPERPTAELGRILLVRPLSGKVFVKVPGSHKFVRLESLSEVPVRSLIDTRRGKVRLRSARNTKGKTQYGDFAGGIFQALQSRRKKAKGLTELRLKGGNRKKVCGGGGSRATRSSDQPAAQTARRRRRRWRRLRHRARGRFRTRGRHSAATVRGTTWTVADRCDGTLTSVKRGKVVVRDFRRHKNILVRRGKRYLAKAP